MIDENLSIYCGHRYFHTYYKNNIFQECILSFQNQPSQIKEIAWHHHSQYRDTYYLYLDDLGLLFYEAMLFGRFLQDRGNGFEVDFIPSKIILKWHGIRHIVAKN